MSDQNNKAVLGSGDTPGCRASPDPQDSRLSLFHNIKVPLRLGTGRAVQEGGPNTLAFLREKSESCEERVSVSWRQNSSLLRACPPPSVRKGDCTGPWECLLIPHWPMNLDL